MVLEGVPSDLDLGVELGVVGAGDAGPVGLDLELGVTGAGVSVLAAGGLDLGVEKGDVLTDSSVSDSITAAPSEVHV